MPTQWAPRSAKDERQRLLTEWQRQGLGVDQIARRFRLEYGVGALTAYRWANDLTQLEVANSFSERFMGADERLFPQRISEFEKWPREHGGREPPLSVLERLAVLYHTTTDRLVAAVLSNKATDDDGDDAVQQPVGLMPLVDATATGERQSPSRLQGWLAFGELEQLGPDLLDRLAVEERTAHSVDPNKVERLEAATAIHRALYHCSSPAELLDALRGHLSAVILALRNTERSGLRRRLAAIAAETAGHVAWLCHELNDDRSATRYYAVSAMAIRQAGHPGLDAYVQGFKSQVWYRRGDIEQARLLAEGASRKAAQGRSATLRSWLWALRGQALADLGDKAGCVAALTKAEAAMERARPEEDPPWMDAFDPGRFAALAGSCYRKLGQLEAAEELLQLAMTQLDPSGARRRGMALLELALVEVDKGDLERACRLASEALQALVGIGSLAGVHQVVQLRSLVERRGGTSALADLDEQFAALL
jgi:tetratricopeptide (TPR) repeat protein/transposase